MTAVENGGQIGGQTSAKKTAAENVGKKDGQTAAKSAAKISGQTAAALYTLIRTGKRAFCLNNCIGLRRRAPPKTRPPVPLGCNSKWFRKKRLSII
jgi:hypothetical protein